MTSNGTQYDRLATFTLHETESVLVAIHCELQRLTLISVWRTSTPEPTRGDGIIWTYVKDVSRYTKLFATPGTFVFQLDNIVQPRLDGEYYCE